MTKEQEDKIKDITGYTYHDLILLPNNRFEWLTAGLKLQGKLTQIQYDWLVKQRSPVVDKQTQDILDIFGGTIL